MNNKVGNIINDLPCDIIQDLLPSYADGLTSDIANESIKAHIANCPDCRKILTDMVGNESEKLSVNGKECTAAETGAAVSDRQAVSLSEFDRAEPGRTESEARLSELPEIDYMKKIRKKGRRNILLAVLAIVLIFITGIFLKLFVIGYAVHDFYGTAIEVRTAESAAEKELVVKGQFFDSATVFRRYKLEGRGSEKELIIYGALPSFIRDSGSFEIVLPLDGETQIQVNGETILPDGQRISRLANELYKAKNPYIGDMPANNALAELLSISSRLGSYTNELQTAQEPYSWELKFGDSWKRRFALSSYAYENSLTPFEKLNDKMRSYAYVLLALIDNCNEIKWSYTDDKGDTIYESLDLDTANEFLEIKDFGRSALDVQKLPEAVGIE